MSNEIAVKKDITKEHELSIIEQVVMQGDLSKLNPIQRVTYYNKVCESMGLNPYTRPFDYISLNGKLTLYAKKDATEQLRQVKKISIVSLEGRMVDDLYIVVAKATTPDGRLDQSTGAVSIGNLKGEQKANAIMKAETKAKRRVTLSISGMGWTDESEIESIPNARHVEVDVETGEIRDKQIEQPKQIEEKPIEFISTDQALMIGSILAKCDADYRKKVLKTLKDSGIESLEKIPLSLYERILIAAVTKQDEHQKSSITLLEIKNEQSTTSTEDNGIRG